MAGAGWRRFQPGEVLTATNLQSYGIDQSVQVYPDSAARGSAIGTAVSDGMVSYIADTNSVEVYKTFGTAIAGWESNTVPLSPNYIINGAFEINQRNASSVTTNGAFVFDRTRLSANTGTVTYSTQSFTAGAAPVAGYEFRNFARLVVSGQSAVDARAALEHNIEDVRTLSGQVATVSFWAKAASGTPSVAVSFQQYFGTGGSPSASVDVAVGKVALTTSWARYSLTVALPSLTGKTVGTNNDSALTATFWGSAGSNFNARTSSLGIQSNTFDFWGLQVESGSSVTPFRRNANSLQGELAACQRYYYRVGGQNLYATIGFGAASTSNLANIAVNNPVTMRAIPTSIESSNLGLWDGVITSAATTIALRTGHQTFNTTTLTVGVAGSPLSQFRPYFLFANESLSGFLGVSAEL